MATAEFGKTSAKAPSVLNIIAAIWMIISPFMLRFTGMQDAMWNSFIVGFAVLLLAWGRAANPVRYVGLSWLNFLLGVWSFISPFVLMYSAFPRPTWNNIVVGVIVAVLGIWGAVSKPVSHQFVSR